MNEAGKEGEKGRNLSKRKKKREGMIKTKKTNKTR